MMKFHRPAQPPFLQEKYKSWGKAHHERRLDNPSAPLVWRTYQGTRVNELILAALNVVANDHCAFCDGYPLSTFARQTIEHFRPVSQYPRLAYVWGNLFICCDHCQAAKRDQFDKLLLKPDALDYEFEQYFMVNYRTGEIEVNLGATEEDQQRAELTIKIYTLNKPGRPQSRRIAAEMYQDLPKEKYVLDDFPYRFFLV
jgi:uncharacterized protein (TIGR02646 family)